jgi:hypothetical protein
MGITTGTIDGYFCDNNGVDCTVLAAPQNVDSGEYKAFQFIIPEEATDTSNIGRDVCEISFCAPGGTGGDGYFITTGQDAGTCASGHLVTKQIVIRVT